MLALAAGPGAAAKPQNRLASYVAARGAEIQGQEARSAKLFTDLALANPGDSSIARRAIVNAIQSGEAEIAVPLARKLPRDELGFDGRLLLTVDALRHGREAEALAMLRGAKTSTETEVLAPLVEAWMDTEAGRPAGVEALARLSPENPLAPTGNFQRINMLLTLKRTDEALSLARTLFADREGSARQRIAVAAGFAREGRKDAALEMLAGADEPVVRARQLIEHGQKLPDNLAIDSANDGVAELLLILAAELSRNNDGGLPLALARIAGYAMPDHPAPHILAAVLLDGQERADDALVAIRKVAPTDIYAADAIDLEARILTNADRKLEALARVERAGQSPDATLDEINRYADVLGELDRHAEAADAYGRAIVAAKRSGATKNLWTLHLLRAASLEEADRWPDAKTELQAAMALQPDNPVVLNYLGYGKLERGEDIDAAEAMIRKASAMRPDDASITDSLGWALFKRGNLSEAIDTLLKAASGDPAQAEIHEHLGDALYTSGRRMEARFAWNAALVNADKDTQPRLQAKLAYGLNSSNAAP